MTTAELLDDGGMILSEVTDVDEVIALLQKANHDRPRQLWEFYTDGVSVHAPSLGVGLDGERGVLFWPGYRPADGSNREPVDYWWAGHHSPIEAGHEVSARQVFNALREFLTTGKRPTCIEWVES